MRARTVLVLLVLVVGLVAFIELYESDLPSSQERLELEKRALGDLEARDIETVEISRQDTVIRIERQGQPDGGADQWSLTEPLAARADVELVEALIESLVGLEKTRTLSGISRVEAGLEPPRLVATLSSASGEIEVEFGNEMPVGGSMIVAVGDEIVVVDGGVGLDLARVPGDWRSRRIIHRTDDQVTNISLESRDVQIVFARRGTDFWIVAPVEDRADADRVGKLLNEVVSMRKATFVDDPSDSLAEMGIDPPIGVAEIWFDNRDQSSKIRWGAKDPTEATRFFAEVEGQVFTTDSNLQQFLGTPVEDWRSRDLTSMATYQIDRLEILQPGEEPLTLLRDGADWRRNEDTISFTTVSELLYAITGLQAERVLREVTADSLRSGSSEPVMEVMMGGDDREQTAAFFPSLDGGIPTTIDDRQVALLVSDNEFAEVAAKLREVRAAPSMKIDDDEQHPTAAGELSSDQ